MNVYLNTSYTSLSYLNNKYIYTYMEYECNNNIYLHDSNKRLPYMRVRITIKYE